MIVYRHTCQKHSVRSVGFYDVCAWVVIGLERDVGSQGTTIHEAVARFDSAVNFDVEGCLEFGVTRDPSPQKYHRMWDHAMELE